MPNPFLHIFEHTPATLRDWAAGHGMKPFRAKQILEWVYAKGVVDPAQMTNLSAHDRDTLARKMVFLSGPTLTHQTATDGTQKLLIQWEEGIRDWALGNGEEETRCSDPESHISNLKSPPPPPPGPSASAGSLAILPTPDPSRQTECVMIPSLDSPRRTACISSQVGCPVRCSFCATGLGGLDGNLSAGRIIEQVWRLGQLLGGSALRADTKNPGQQGGSDDQSNLSARRADPPRADPPRISNVVFMGMGEPLANFGPVVHAVRTIAADWGMRISARKITISTVGLPRAIERLADELDLPVTLALSLHAPNDELRRSLIPWSEYTTIEELLAACKKWFDKTGREITLEYILLGSVNDRPEHAHELAAVARTIRANVNLIRYNEVDGLDFRRPAANAVHAFQAILRSRGVNAHIRASRGRDIAAACGQLRHKTSGAQ